MPIAAPALKQKYPDFYKPYLDHLKAIGENSLNSQFFPTPEKVAAKLYKIVGIKAPKWKYNLAIDAIAKISII